MDFRTREAVRKSRIFLLENVIFDVLTDHLIDQDIFSESMLEYIQAGNDRIEKIRRMLDFLVRRPGSCYTRFLTALTNSGQEHCVNCIQQNYVQSGPTQVSDPGTDTVTNPTTNHGPRSGEAPMESSSSAFHSEHLPFPIKTVELGFAEIPTSMHVHAGSFTNFPVQESSSPGGEINPSTAYTYNPYEFSGGDINGVEHMCVSSSGDDNAPFYQDTGREENMTVYQRHILSHPNNVYKMQSNPRGLTLVINNEKFKAMSDRTGSKRDMEKLHILFKGLGFHICQEVDKTAKEMRVLLKTFTEYAPLQEVDALAVVILSHGSREGVIFGTDGTHGKGLAQDYITDEEIRDIFSARNCPLMVHKPKLIIIQACRGTNEDVADGVHPHHRPQSHTSDIKQLGQDGSSVCSSGSTTLSARTANMADICLIHSTVQGYVSYRHPVEGSPFIQELTRVFQDQASREHLTDMMTEVNRNLSSRQLQEDLRTVPSTTNTLTKKWFLNPPH